MKSLFYATAQHKQAPDDCVWCSCRHVSVWFNKRGSGARISSMWEVLRWLFRTNGQRTATGTEMYKTVTQIWLKNTVSKGFFLPWMCKVTHDRFHRGSNNSLAPPTSVISLFVMSVRPWELHAVRKQWELPMVEHPSHPHPLLLSPRQDVFPVVHRLPAWERHRQVLPRHRHSVTTAPPQRSHGYQTTFRTACV